MASSKDGLLLELREKEHELEDAMMIVSLLQEQIKSKGGEEADKITSLLEEIKDKNSLLPKVAFLQNGFYDDCISFNYDVSINWTNFFFTYFTSVDKLLSSSCTCLLVSFTIIQSWLRQESK